MTRTRPWEVSDEWWEKVKPLIPPAPSHAKGGRPRMGDRRVFAAIPINWATEIPPGEEFALLSRRFVSYMPSHAVGL